MGNKGHVKPLNKTHTINKRVSEHAKMLHMKYLFIFINISLLKRKYANYWV